MEEARQKYMEHAAGGQGGTSKKKRVRTRRSKQRKSAKKKEKQASANAGNTGAGVGSAAAEVVDLLSSEEEGEVRNVPMRTPESEGGEGRGGAGSVESGRVAETAETGDEPVSLEDEPISPVLKARPSLQYAAHRVFSDDAEVAALGGSGGGEGEAKTGEGDGTIPRTRTRGRADLVPQWGPQKTMATKAKGPGSKVKGPATRASASVLNLLERRKLALVLDLDHTLLNSCMSTEMADEPEAGLLKFRLDHERGLGPDGKTLHFVERLQIWTKLRPGVKKFLRQAAAMFEVHVITMGSQSYADEMRQLIDPGRQHIKGSVIGLGQMDEFGELRPADKKRLDGELSGLDSIAVVLDDHVGVWPDHEENLIEIDRYLYFPSALKQFGMWRHGASLLEKRVDEVADRSTLSAAFEVLRRVHQDFFAERAAHLALANKKAKDAEMADLAWGLDSESEGDGEGDGAGRKNPEITPNRKDPQVPVTVPEILALEKRKILAGTELVFSGVFPLDAAPQTHKMWRLAEQFGARCETQPGPNTSHVVAKTWGTGKCQWAKENGKHVVSPDWLFCSAFLWSKADERAFNPPDHRK
jgi:RNA polymerase II C-terminal domain phosphatase-like 3/4